MRKLIALIVAALSIAVVVCFGKWAFVDRRSARIVEQLRTHGAEVGYRSGVPVSVRFNAPNDLGTGGFTTISRREVDLLAQLRTLEAISLRATAVDEASLARLSALPKLKYLDVSANDLTPSDCRILATFPALAELDIGGNEILDDGAREIARCTHLEKLDISYAEITDEGLAHIGTLWALKWLRIGGNRALTDEGLARLQQSGLTTLIADRTRLHGAGLCDVAFRESLLVLDARDSPLDNQGCRCIGHLKRLKVLDLSGTHVSREGIELLLDLTELERLNLDRAFIFSNTANELVQLPKLRAVGLLSTFIDPQQLLKEVAALRRFQFEERIAFP